MRWFVIAWLGRTMLGIWLELSIFLHTRLSEEDGSIPSMSVVSPKSGISNLSFTLSRYPADVSPRIPCLPFMHTAIRYP